MGGSADFCVPARVPPVAVLDQCSAIISDVESGEATRAAGPDDEHWCKALRTLEYLKQTAQPLKQLLYV
jgi:hypothetical protein